MSIPKQPDLPRGLKLASAVLTFDYVTRLAMYTSWQMDRVMFVRLSSMKIYIMYNPDLDL